MTEAGNKATRQQGNSEPESLTPIPFEVADPADAPPEFPPGAVATLYPMIAPLREGRAIRVKLDDIGSVLPVVGVSVALNGWLCDAPPFFRRLGIEVYTVFGDNDYWIVPLSVPLHRVGGRQQGNEATRPQDDSEPEPSPPDSVTENWRDSKDLLPTAFPRAES